MISDTVPLACYNNTVSLLKGCYKRNVHEVYAEYVKIAPHIESALGGIADPLVAALKALYDDVLPDPEIEELLAQREKSKQEQTAKANAFDAAMNLVAPLNIPARLEMVVLPADPPDRPKLGFMMYERSPDSLDYVAEELQATALADTYKEHVLYTQNQSHGYTSLDVLPFLVGRPWDQCALNFVHSLRPSALRVVTQGTTLDSVPWRVTVYLDPKGGRTIKNISQEVQVGIVGCAHGHGLQKYIAGEDPAHVLCYVNTRGIRKLELSNDG